MDIGSAFTFVFDDEDWIKKVAIGGGITLLSAILTPIIIGLALWLPIGGYILQTIKNVRDGQAKPLPEWTDIGGLFSKGLMVFVIALIYNIPSVLLWCASFGISLAAPNLDSDVAQALSFVTICVGCLQVIVGIVAYALLPAALIRYAQFDSLGSAFQFREIFSFISANIGDYIIAVLLSWVAGLVAVFGLILCIVGVFFTVFWSYLVTANLIGQLARKAETST